MNLSHCQVVEGIMHVSIYRTAQNFGGGGLYNVK